MEFIFLITLISIVEFSELIILQLLDLSKENNVIQWIFHILLIFIK